MSGTASMTSAELTAFLSRTLARRNRTQVFPDRGYEATQMILAKSSPGLTCRVDGPIRIALATDPPIGSLPWQSVDAQESGTGGQRPRPLAATLMAGVGCGPFSGSESRMNEAPPLDRLRA